MGFWESLVMTIFAKKVLKEVSNEFSRDQSTNGRHSGGMATYQGLRNTYYDIHQMPSSLLNELFRREPDFIDKTCGEDARELLNVVVVSYEYRGQRVWGENWFTISAKYRFLYKGMLSSIMDQNFRDYEIVDYSERPFAPVANPAAHSITIGNYTLYFNHTLYYNLTLMLLLDSDRKFGSGHRVTNRAIRYPLVSLSNDLLQQYDISIDEHSREGMRLTNASYAVLDDYNGDDFHNTSSGTIEVRVIDGRVHKSDYDMPYSVGDLITKRDDVERGFIWITVTPGMVFQGNYIINVPFDFLKDIDELTIRGNGHTQELYVCRRKEGWGGIRFKVKNKTDYYKLSAWLVVALSYYCSVIHGWDYRESITRYWPDCPFC